MSTEAAALRDAREKVREAESVLAAAISHFDHCLDTVQARLVADGIVPEVDFLLPPDERSAIPE